MGGRHGDALAAQAVVDLLADAWTQGAAERTLDLYGPPRRTLTVRSQVIDDGRRTLGVIAVIDDISERRRLEEIRRDFVANVSHELKTPMGALGLLAETLVSETDPTVASRLAERIHTEAFRVSRIIDDLLDLSRIEAEEAPPREPVLVNLVMAEAVERMRAAADQRDVKIVLEEPDPPVAVLGDRRQLVSALYNLLENAVKFSYEGGTVRCAGQVVDDEVRLEVEDHGVGIPTRDLERIFERFYRVDQGRSRSTGGTGLGPVDRPPRRRQPPGPGRGRLARGRGLDLPAHPARALRGDLTMATHSKRPSTAAQRPPAGQGRRRRAAPRPSRCSSPRTRTRSSRP